jgi:flagellar hook-length control protein FliK
MSAPIAPPAPDPVPHAGHRSGGRRHAGRDDGFETTLADADRALDPRDRAGRSVRPDHDPAPAEVGRDPAEPDDATPTRTDHGRDDEVPAPRDGADDGTDRDRSTDCPAGAAVLTAAAPAEGPPPAASDPIAVAAAAGDAGTVGTAATSSDVGNAAAPTTLDPVVDEAAGPALTTLAGTTTTSTTTATTTTAGAPAPEPSDPESSATAGAASPTAPADGPGPAPEPGVLGRGGEDLSTGRGPRADGEPAPTPSPTAPAPVAVPAVPRGSAAAGTAATPAAPTPSPPVPLDDLGAHLAGRLRRLDGATRLELQLHPAELGAVSVEVRIEDGLTHLHLRAAHGGTVERIDASLAELRDDLRRSGVAVGDVGVGAGDSGRSPEREPHVTGPPAAGGTPAGDRPTHTEATAPAPRPSTRPTGLDVRL